MDPRNVVREVVHRRYAGKCVRLTGGLEHGAETDVIPVAVATLREGLAGKAITKVVNPVVPNCQLWPAAIPRGWLQTSGELVSGSHLGSVCLS